MDNTFTFLPWDTKFFGYKIGSITAKNLTEEALSRLISALEKKGVVLIYLYIDPDDVLSAGSAQKANAYLVDAKVTYSRTVPAESGAHFPTYPYSYIHPSANARLRDLTLQCGQFSRFKLDCNFRNNEFERLYSCWIEKSVARKIAKDVLVYEADGQELGLATLRVVGGMGHIGLFVVDTQVRRRSIGKTLMECIYQKCREYGLGNIQVVTQKANKHACCFYEKCRFIEKRTEHIYHLWVAKNE